MKIEKEIVKQGLFELYKEYKDYCDNCHQYDMTDSVKGFFMWLLEIDSY